MAGCLLLTISPVASLTISTVSSLVPTVAPAPASAPHGTAPRATDGSPHAPTHHAHRVRLGRGLLDIDFMAIDVLFGGLEEVCHHCLLLKCDEAEALALVLLLVEGKFHLHNVTKLAKVILDVIIAEVWLEAAHKDLAVPRLRLLGVNLLTVDDMVTRIDHLPNRQENNA